MKGLVVTNLELRFTSKRHYVEEHEPVKLEIEGIETEQQYDLILKQLKEFGFKIGHKDCFPGRHQFGEWRGSSSSQGMVRMCVSCGLRQYD